MQKIILGIILILSCVKAHTGSILDTVEFKLDNYEMPAVEDDVLFLAINAYFEDRQHSYKGMYYVHLVVLNRLNYGRRGRWPDTIEEIIMQPSNDPTRPLACKFSWTCDSQDDIIDDEKSFALAIKTAQDAIAEWEYDRSMGSLWYYKCGLHLSQSWMRKIKFNKRVGKHCFFGEK